MTTPETEKEPAEAAKANSQPVRVSSARGAGDKGVLVVMFTILLIACAWLLFNVNSRLEEASERGHQPNIIVIDVAAIQLAKKEELQERLPSYEQVMREVDIFTNDLQDILRAYADAGIVVLNRNAIISAPESLDVTRLIADRLHIRMPERFQ